LGGKNSSLRFIWGKTFMGSDPAKWLLLMRYGFKKGVFLLLECTFGSPKVGFKDFGCWVLDSGFWVLDAGCWVLGFGLGPGLYLLRLRRRKHKSVSITPGIR